VLWGPQLPAKGIILLLVGLSFYFFLQGALASALRGLSGFSLRAYLQTYPTSPLLAFGYILAIHLVLRGSFGFFKGSHSGSSGIADLARDVSTVSRLPSHLFAGSAATLVFVGWVGFTLRGFRETPQAVGLQPLTQPSSVFLSTPSLGLQQNFIRSVSSRKGQVLRLPALAFKLNDRVFEADSGCPVVMEVPATCAVHQEAYRILVNTLPHAVTLRGCGLDSGVAGLS